MANNEATLDDAILYLPREMRRLHNGITKISKSTDKFIRIFLLGFTQCSQFSFPKA